MTMRILVTGITGFAGSFLAEALLPGRDVQLWGVHRPGKPLPGSLPAGALTWAACDLADRAATIDLVRQAKPDQIYHLAGYASTGRSYREPDTAWEGNLTATRNLLAAVTAWGGQPRILHVSSGLVYGEPKEADQLVNEEALLRPASPYAASKAAADLAAYQASRTAGLPIIRVRPFNHIGPRQSPDFAVSHFAQQLAAIEAGRQAPLLETGDLRPRRDLTDVRDMVRAYQLLMDKGTPGAVYNAGSGQAWSMHEVLERLLALGRVRPEIRQKTQPERAREAAALRADCRKLRDATGWQPQHSLDQTLADTLNYWRAVTR
jgi:GDP-4-dehydro-6-deoxy-D-mannose reductase